MKEKKYEKNGRITGAVLSGIVFCIFFVFMMVVFTILQFMEEPIMPPAIYLYFMATFLIPTIGIGVSLYFRIREIKSGEEDEAKKY